MTAVRCDSGLVIVVIEVEEDPRYLREGSDLIYDLPVSFSQAALGQEVEKSRGYIARAEGAAQGALPGPQSSQYRLEAV